MRPDPLTIEFTTINAWLRGLLLSSVLISCSKNPAPNEPTSAPAQATAFRGEVYRSLDDGTVITIVSPEELERRQPGDNTNFICKYTKTNDTIRVVATMLGTPQALYYKIEDQGLRGNDGTFLYAPKYLDVARVQQKANDALGKGDLAEAIAGYTEVIKLDPKYALAYRGRGLANLHRNTCHEALADLNEAVRLDIKDAGAVLFRGWVYERLGEYEKALGDYAHALQLEPKSDFVYNSFAWLWATCPEAGLRDGTKAVEYATKANQMQDWKRFESLDTLAAAYAESGNFAKALEWQKKALQMGSQDQRFVKKGRERLALYEEHIPYREEPLREN